MTGLPRTSFLLSALLACGPGSDTTDATDTTDTSTAGPATTTGGSTAATADTTPTTTGDPLTTGDTSTTTTATTAEDTSTTTATTTTADTTTDPTGTPDACDPFPLEGEPCDVDGTFCNTGCDNQCEFCNVVQCTGGVWEGLEVFPAPCLDCPGICEFTVQPMCDGGPPDLDTCVAGCMDSMSGRCEIPFADMLACAGQMPTFTCDAADRPLVEGCEAEFDALYMCLGI